MLEKALDQAALVHSSHGALDFLWYPAIEELRHRINAPVVRVLGVDGLPQAHVHRHALTRLRENVANLATLAVTVADVRRLALRQDVSPPFACTFSREGLIIGRTRTYSQPSPTPTNFSLSFCLSRPDSPEFHPLPGSEVVRELRSLASKGTTPSSPLLSASASSFRLASLMSGMTLTGDESIWAGGNLPFLRLSSKG
jgi:hypothetical protein